ncbi:MAG TPA: polyhydroxyalkanoic acid system family protein, partial [Pseudomonadales bacterium]|nr:polyhydroxyalkanoic acid system family protein [Pseudomonadales bacterium]
MADIHITRRHGLANEAAARTEIEALAEELVRRFGGSWAWRGPVATCDIRGARGEVSCEGDRVVMKVTLPLLMKALRGPLESEI